MIHVPFVESTFSGLLPSRCSSTSKCWDWPAPGFLGSDRASEGSQKPRASPPALLHPRCRPESLLEGRFLELQSPHLSGQGSVFLEGKSPGPLPAPCPHPSQPPMCHPAQIDQPQGDLMWGTQVLSKVCLHLACFAAVAHWGGDRTM